MPIENRYDIEFVAQLAAREKQNQQAYRPTIGVHKWFARRSGSLFRSLLLAEFCNQPLRRTYFKSHQFPGQLVADPFCGGGTSLLEANRIGCDVIGGDVNFLPFWITSEAIEDLDCDQYQFQTESLRLDLLRALGELYVTDCPETNARDLSVKYFLWVKTIECEQCARTIDLFPSYLIAEAGRHSHSILVCASCGELNPVATLFSPGTCRQCTHRLKVEGPASGRRCRCANCNHENNFPRTESGPPTHRLFAIEYHCPDKAAAKVRFFKKPDSEDIQRYALAAKRLKKMRSRYIPSDVIGRGVETARLLGWGSAPKSGLR